MATISAPSRPSTGISKLAPSLLSTIFHPMVDAIVCTWFASIEGTTDIMDVCRLLVCFYADDDLIVGRDPALLQQAFNAITGPFICVFV